MDGRAFLKTARRLARGQDEEDWRTAAGRAYYALLLECRDALGRWGFSLPPRDRVHAFVRLRFFVPADRDLRLIGQTLENLLRDRNRADYEIAVRGPSLANQNVLRRIQESQDAIDLLDAIEADPTRRSAAVAAITAAFPP